AQVSQPTTSFYMRALPSTCISFASKDGRIIFHQALGGPFMECYYALAMHYVTQSEPAYCGLSTLVMCLNALEVDPLRQWKGVWRWFDESTLETVRDLSEVQVDGITIAEFECMARMNGLTPECRRADSVSKEMFVQDLKRACASQTEIMTISYFRGTLNQTGMGHFSPIGGYNESTNQVLVFDVARFKYSAYWVSADLLWESMLPIDESTGKSRGYCLL
ncbi:PCS-1 protein, partial [Chytriomyces sp. MP71]